MDHKDAFHIFRVICLIDNQFAKINSREDLKHDLKIEISKNLSNEDFLEYFDSEPIQ